MNSARQALFDDLQAQARHSVDVVDVTSPDIAQDGHRSWVWNASDMPAGGHYFPIYVDLIKRLEGAGEIAPDRHVLVETTTGTAGMALGHIADRLGYRIVLFMPEDMPARRVAAVRDRLPEGSDLILTPSGQYVSGLVREFRRFCVNNRDGYQGLQLSLLDHSRRPEAVDSLRAVLCLALGKLSEKFRVDYAVGALGNGTSSAALFAAARHQNPDAIRVGVEPIEAPMAFLSKFGDEAFALRFGKHHVSRPHALLGTGGWGVKFPHLDVESIDEILPLSPEVWQVEQNIAFARKLEFGNSTAACQAAVRQIALRSRRDPHSFFSILYDRAHLY